MMIHRTVRTNGVDLHVLDAGPEDGPVVVLAHGFPELSYSWRHQVPALARAGYRVLENKYYLDWLYTDVIVAFTKGPLARMANRFNQQVLDGIVNGTATVSRFGARLAYDYFDQKVVDGVVNGSGRGASETGGLLRRIQTGRIQQYAALLFAGAAVLAGVLVFAV